MQPLAVAAAGGAALLAVVVLAVWATWRVAAATAKNKLQ